jgi:mRNA-degrading endonuclease RelE of RelBE toxin-antitoxin system
MHKQIVLTKKFIRSMKRLSRSLQQIVEEKIAILKGNPAYPSLKVHRALRAREKNVWICYVGSSLRLLYSIKGDSIYLQDVGPHGIVDHLGA